MQQILNAKERNQAFLQFFILFLVTVVLTTAAVYFNYRMPSKVNDLLTDELNTQRAQDTYQQRFMSQLHDAKVYLDSLDKRETNVNLIDMQLTEKITGLLNLQQIDSSLYGQVDKTVVETLLELQQAKKKLISLNGQADKMSEMQAQLQQYKTNLSVAEAQLDNFRNKPGM